MGVFRMSRSRTVNGVALLVVAGVAVMGTASLASADSGARGAAVGSPGVLSGNVVQVPVNIPGNLCGNTVNVGGLLNPAVGNVCVNGGGHGAWK